MNDRLWPLYNETELADLPQPSWLVEKHLIDGLCVLYGPPKAGKTFLALSWALSVSTGLRWFGFDVEHAPVVYVSGEGTGGLHRRIRAWKRQHSVVGTKLYVIPTGVRFGRERDHAVGLRNDIFQTKARLLVVDTLARSMAGQDENSAQDMGQTVQALDWIRETTGCAVLVVHHSGVEGSRPRGSTALFGAADTLMRVEGDGKSLDLSCEGQKDASPFASRRFDFEQVDESVVLREGQRRAGSFSVV